MDLKGLRRKWKRPGTAEDGDKYQTAKNGYIGRIRDSKRAQWRAFSGGMNNDVWGRAFKWARNGTREQADLCLTIRAHGETITIEQTLSDFLDKFVSGIPTESLDIR